MVGYVGCDDSPVDFPYFQSNNETGAYKIRPDLCPYGKYGYDCRCRDWYAQAKIREVHITPPYVFSQGDIVGTSAASTIRDPVTSELVGEALLDFLPAAFTKALGPSGTVIGPGDLGFPLVITADEDIYGGNTLIGPGT
jgi:hypothetical protein